MVEGSGIIYTVGADTVMIGPEELDKHKHAGTDPRAFANLHLHPTPAPNTSPFLEHRAGGLKFSDK